MASAEAETATKPILGTRCVKCAASMKVAAFSTPDFHLSENTMTKNPLFSSGICQEGFSQVFSAPIETDAAPQHEHPRLTELPHWPNETIAVLCTVDEAPYAIPVTAPVRVGDRKILLALNDCRGSLARLQKNPRVALLILSAGDLAFTVRGRAYVVDTTIVPPSEFVAVAIEAEAIDDHRLPGRAITSGAEIDWDRADVRHLLQAHLAALAEIGGERQRHQSAC